MLRHIKNSHNDIKGIRNDQNSHKGFKNPFEKHKSFNIVEIILFNDHVYQLVAHHKGQNYTGNGDDDVIG
ncbi:hypothetical protein SDC9_117957 [bioreactor metagenome]|uniref:Uncharacterized protein n=1 Tax=bioreactor metagenome TaxID=1076179 RepID=A0A645C8N3_9ZZZZ